MKNIAGPKSYPRIGGKILRWILPYAERECLMGDFHEMFLNILRNRGRLASWAWFWSQLILLLPQSLGDSIRWRFLMFRNYLIASWRGIKRYKGFSFINITGLAVGLVCFILIGFYVRHETSFDNFHEGGNRIYRVACQFPGNPYMGSDCYAVGPAPLAAALMEEVPEVELATKFGFPRNSFLGRGDDGFFVRVFYADSYFFNVFSFKLLAGDKIAALAEPNCAVISRNVAEKYFKGENPLGKTIFNNIKITAVVENVPENSHIQFDCVVSFANQFSLEERDQALQNWADSSYYTYVKLREGSDDRSLREKILSVVGKHLKLDEKRNYLLQPLESIHLKSHVNFEISPNNDIRVIVLFMSIAFLVLMIAGGNYMNIATARVSNRAKEIGVRKVVGAARNQLFGQFAGESILIVLISLALALILARLLLPFFSSFAGIKIPADRLFDPGFLAGMTAVAILMGFFAGLYPALFFSSFRLDDILRGTTSRLSGKERMRKILVVFQFGMAIILLSSGFVVFQQIHFIRSKTIGYDRENIVVLRLNDAGVLKSLEAFKNEIEKNSGVVGMTASSSIPTTVESGQTGIYEDQNGSSVGFHATVCAADYDFLNVYKMKIVEGRDFSKTYGTDEDHAVIVNEAFVRKANWKNPIGNKVATWIKGTVVGVVKDFHFQSLHLDIKPLVINCSPGRDTYASIRIRGDDVSGTLSHIKKTFERFRTRFPFEYRFLDDVFNGLYEPEQKLGTMLGLFSILAVFITCLGLFGLALNSCERRTKEISIRKVLGASSPGILALLWGEFANLIVIANILAWPPAYYFAKKWLQKFAYRMDLGIGTFILAGAFALSMALIAVSYQSVKAARANPVDSLRYGR
jgi:putative ABC transport system permease protein